MGFFAGCLWTLHFRLFATVRSWTLHSLDNLSIFLYSFFRLDMYIRIGNVSTGIVHEQILTIPVRGMQKSGFWSVIPLHFGKYRKKLSVRYTQNCVSHPSPRITMKKVFTV